ncbi:MAG: hypothetical protein HY849_02340 [Nitrosomonadales bacterium]|nr:hypothetical protein [Nitrosomonadales bacterium]
MTIKRVLDWQRVRRIPAQFSWLDQRLVRDRHIERCDAPACALYLFLVTVADAQGLSYYADASIAKRLSMEPARVGQARADLVRLGLIAYESPLYQVLALDAPVSPAPVCEISPLRWRERTAELRTQLKAAR